MSADSDESRATRKIETPIGALAVTAGPEGVTAITWEDPEAGDAPADPPEAPDGDPSGRREDSPAERTAADAARQISEYFGGERRSFDLALDLEVQPPFRRRVLEELARIPCGETIAYGELAERCGRPGAARAVGNAVARNPVPVLLPCHRVVRADGTPGRYGGGRERKRRLLRLEGALPVADPAPGPSGGRPG